MRMRNKQKVLTSLGICRSDEGFSNIVSYVVDDAEWDAEQYVIDICRTAFVEAVNEREEARPNVVSYFSYI